MKSKTIMAIESLLEKDTIAARDIYKDARAKLEKKYHTEWLDKELTEEELVILTQKKETFIELENALRDFKEHQW